MCSSLCVFWEGRGRGGEAGAWMCIFSVAIYLCVKRMACWISILAFLKAELLFFVVISCRNSSTMAPKKRVRDVSASRPEPFPKTKAIRTLEDHGILNGFSAKNYWCVKTWYRSEHFKNQGLPNDVAEKNALHILHSNTTDRRRYFDLLISGGTTMSNVVKVIEKYREELTILQKVNQEKPRWSQILVIDINGVVH